VPRLAAAAVTVAGVVAASFFALVALPGDPLTAFAPADQLTGLGPERIAELRAELGLDRPLPARFASWAARVAVGDLGTSFRTRRPVAREILERLGPTLQLNLAALALIALVGVPLGWAAARRPGSAVDRWGAVGLLALYAVPTVWLALLLQDLFAVHWGLLPLYGRVPADGSSGLLVRLRHLAMPAACLAAHQLAFFALFARDSARQGYLSRHAAVARAAGVGEPRLFAGHAIRPSLPALAALLGLLVPAQASGSVLVETVFAWHGLGQYFLDGVLSRDVPVVLGMTLVSGLLTVAGSLAADLFGRFADPRSRAGAPA